MRHQRKRNKLSRDAGHRKALVRNLCGQVIHHERVRTTEAKAKVVKPEVDKLITLAKRGDLHARRLALSELNQDKFLVHKLFDEVAPPSPAGRRSRGCGRSRASSRRRSRPRSGRASSCRSRGAPTQASTPGRRSRARASIRRLASTTL